MLHDVGISLDKIVLTSDIFNDTHNETFPSQRRPLAFIRPMDDHSGCDVNSSNIKHLICKFFLIFLLSVTVCFFVVIE